MSDFELRTVTELARMIRRRETTSTEVTSYFLQRLEQRGPTYNCVATITHDRALAEAQRADELGRRGRWRGPLHGVPYGVKDLIAAEGYPTTWGAEPFRDRVLPGDATIVRRLTDAGAVLVAKLAMVELAGGMGYQQANAAWTGPGKTPWNTDYWSGGSSSGAGSAVSAGLVPFAVGSETWGSILVPAAFCGLSGLRPTYGRVSRMGAMALSWTMDKLGPMCKTAEDCAVILEVIAGLDPQDPSTFDRPYRARDTEPRRLSDRLRIGVLKGSTDNVMEEVKENFEGALEAMSDVAVITPDVELPDFPYNQIAATIVNGEGGSAFDDMIEVGAVGKLTAPECRIGGFPDTMVLARDYLRAVRLRRPAAIALDGMFKPFDAIVTPTLGTVAWPLDRPFREAWPEYRGSASLGGGANMAGLPGISVMTGIGRENLPTAMTITGRAYDDAKVLGIARLYQERSAWHRRMPVG